MTNTRLPDLLIRPKHDDDTALIKAFMVDRWGGEPVIINCALYYPSTLPGFLVFRGPTLLGCLIFEVQDTAREIILLEVIDKQRGIGTELLQVFLQDSQAADCRRVHLMTTNDNLDALRFYQRRGFSLSGVRIGACTAGRRLKPSLPEIGDHGIPVRDEILFEMVLPAKSRA